MTEPQRRQGTEPGHGLAGESHTQEASALTLHAYGVSFAGKAILDNVSLSLPRTGMTVLVGPAGGGKSTLLRTLAGLNEAHPSLRAWGSVTIDGHSFPANRWPQAGDKSAPRRPVLVVQHARFFLDTVRENLVSGLPNRSQLDRQSQTRQVSDVLRANGLDELVLELDRDAVTLSLGQQRLLALTRALLGEPAVLLADEPAAGLAKTDAVAVVEALRRQADHRAVVFVTHDQQLARAAGGTTLLLAGGKVQETASTAQFFSSPLSPAGVQFVATGSCPLPSPQAHRPRRDTVDTHAPTSRRAAGRGHRGTTAPRGFFWVEPGRLGGLPRPGIIDSFDGDLEGLQRLGVTRLVTLEERRTVSPVELERLGIAPAHFPIVDMQVPSMADALDFCRQVAQWISDGAVVALHCLAGLGRTGTMLTCQLIWAGASAGSALDRVRAINPRCVQSDVQLDFLRKFEGARQDTPAATQLT